MKTLKSKQAETIVTGAQYLLHISIGEIVTAQASSHGYFWSNCCGVKTLYKPEQVAKFLAIYEYPTFRKTRKSTATK